MSQTTVVGVMRKIQPNDAVLMTYGRDKYIRRVIAVTADGRAICRRKPDDDEVNVENKPGDWPVCGYYEYAPAGWWRDAEWRLVTNDG